LGNVAIVFSIEGGEEETDDWRGNGMYRRIMEAMDMAREATLSIGTSPTVTSKNAEVVSSDAFLDFMIEKGSFAQMYFLYIPVNGRADLTLMVTPEQRDILPRSVLRARNTKPIFIVDFWNDGPYVEGCIAAGRSYFHVNANGDVEPCVYTHIAVDNIHEKSLKEALNSPLFQGSRARQPHNPNHLRPCMIIDNPQVMRISSPNTILDSPIPAQRRSIPCSGRRWTPMRLVMPPLPMKFGNGNISNAGLKGPRKAFTGQDKMGDSGSFCRSRGLRYPRSFGAFSILPEVLGIGPSHGKSTVYPRQGVRNETDLAFLPWEPAATVPSSNIWTVSDYLKICLKGIPADSLGGIDAI
jgi:hypothetical protein